MSLCWGKQQHQIQVIAFIAVYYQQYYPQMQMICISEQSLPTWKGSVADFCSALTSQNYTWEYKCCIVCLLQNVTTCVPHQGYVAGV